jgi:hypothetical protein
MGKYANMQMCQYANVYAWILHLLSVLKFCTSAYWHIYTLKCYYEGF